MRTAKLALMIVVLTAMSAHAQSRPFRLGFTPFPWDYGQNTREQSLEFVAKQGGDIVGHHIDGCVPWPEAIENNPIADALDANWEGLPDKAFNTTPPREYMPPASKVYLALTPINTNKNGLAMQRVGEAPEGFEKRKFSDPLVKKAYLNYCRRAVELFQPDYLAIGIEVNEMLNSAPQLWPDFVELYKHVYAGIKKDHPDLPVFTTLTLHGLLDENRKDAEDRRALVKEFLKINDIAGISFYSFFGNKANAERPVEAFEWLRKFAGDKPVAICETGFPAEATDNGIWPQAPGTPEKQKTYFQTLFDAAQKDEYRFIIVFLHRDYDMMWEGLKDTRPPWHICWKDIGLFDGEGKSRPAWELWQQTLKTPLPAK